MEQWSTSVVIRSTPKNYEGSPHTDHNGRRQEDLQRAITSENKTLPQSWRDVSREATMESSTEGPWNTKHRAIAWSCNPTAQLRCRENRHSDWHVPLDFQGSTTYNRQDTESTKMSLTEKWRLCVHLYTEMLLSHKAERKNDTGSSLDTPRNYHTANTAQSGKDRYPKMPCTAEPMSSYRRTNAQNANRVTGWENQITAERKLGGKIK